MNNTQPAVECPSSSDYDPLSPLRSSDSFSGVVSSSQIENSVKLDVFPQEDIYKPSFFQEHVSALAHLATFAIIGVLVRYALERLFDPSLARVTDVNSALFIDLPANMFGCFFMGWVGMTLKPQLMGISEHLALGLSTGLMGSITTYASWSMSMMKLITTGYWVRGLVGFLIGMELSMASLVIGKDSSKLLLRCTHWKPRWEYSDTKTLKLTSLIISLGLSSVLWIMAFLLLFHEKSSDRKRLWIACTFAPLGVWCRWWLSNLNGQGINQCLTWLPIGTLCANLIACLLEFILNTLELSNVIKSHQLRVLSKGFQFGMLGCMSTVSTLAAEVYSLDRTKSRSYSYAVGSILST